MYYSDPTWGNHGLIFKNAGFTELRKYRYWDPSAKSLAWEGMVEDLNNEALPLGAWTLMPGLSGKHIGHYAQSVVCAVQVLCEQRV